MKYKVTELHPYIKQGTEIEFIKDCDYSKKIHWSILVEDEQYKKCWLDEGYIKEIQEPEHTDDDLKDFIFFCDISDDLDLDILLKKWKESKKNKIL